MSTEGIEAIFLTTHNWGKYAKFFQALGFALEFETDHHSGQLRKGDGPFLFIAEVPEDEAPAIAPVIAVADETDHSSDPTLKMVSPFEDTHWATREAVVQDPDGRLWRLRAPPKR